jgi:bisanhydrobacterioruberin hydratase
LAAQSSIRNYSRIQIATAIAILFHTIGFAGIVFLKDAFFIRATPFNLLLSLFLIVYTQREKNKAFYFFTASVVLLGILVEIAGVNTALVFGSYTYGAALGYRVAGVPLIIGINWLLIIYCCGITIQHLLNRAVAKIAAQTGKELIRIKALSIIVDGASIAVFFDWVIEPVAVKLGYWKWADAEVPLYNYICWFVVSLLLMTIFHFCRFNKQNKFAIHLLLIQLMFFLLLRTFL